MKNLILTLGLSFALFFGFTAATFATVSADASVELITKGKKKDKKKKKKKKKKGECTESKKCCASKTQGTADADAKKGCCASKAEGSAKTCTESKSTEE